MITKFGKPGKSISKEIGEKRRMEWNGIRSLTRRISKYSQNMVRASRSVSLAICGHVVDVSINLGPIRFTNKGGGIIPGHQKGMGREPRPRVQKVKPRKGEPNQWCVSKPIAYVRVWACECDILG